MNDPETPPDGWNYSGDYDPEKWSEPKDILTPEEQAKSDADEFPDHGGQDCPRCAGRTYLCARCYEEGGEVGGITRLRRSFAPDDTQDRLGNLRRGAHPDSANGQLYIEACALLRSRDALAEDLRIANEEHRRYREMAEEVAEGHRAANAHLRETLANLEKELDRLREENEFRRTRLIALGECMVRLEGGPHVWEPGAPGEPDWCYYCEATRPAEPAQPVSEFQGHTPGPWAADGCSDGGIRYHQISCPGKEVSGWPYTIAHTEAHHAAIADEEDAANARLIAAAPDLLRERDELRATISSWKAEEEHWKTREGELMAEVERLRLDVKCRDATLAMTVDRLEGTIEGAPTHRGNFLQRIDELRAVERERDELRERAMEVGLATTIRRDALADALEALYKEVGRPLTAARAEQIEAALSLAGRTP